MKREIVSDLELLINNLRAQMISIGKTKGLIHPETIKCSQELDVAMNRYHTLRGEMIKN